MDSDRLLVKSQAVMPELFEPGVLHPNQMETFCIVLRARDRVADSRGRKRPGP